MNRNGFVRYVCVNCKDHLQLPRDSGRVKLPSGWRKYRGVIQHECRDVRAKAYRRWFHAKMEARPRFLVLPGHVVSQHDAQIHYIGPKDLMRLYNVPLEDCLVIYFEEMNKDRVNHCIKHGMIPLRPRRDGSYDVHHAGQQELALGDIRSYD